MPADQSKSILEEELKFFAEHKADLLKNHEGKFALIKGDKLIGAYTTEAEAYSDGLKRLGNVPFLIKLAVAKDEPIWMQ